MCNANMCTAINVRINVHALTQCVNTPANSCLIFYAPSCTFGERALHHGTRTGHAGCKAYTHARYERTQVRCEWRMRMHGRGRRC